jgi:lipoprotein-anchoring transpeptidase ErfK/SrfK
MNTPLLTSLTADNFAALICFAVLLVLDCNADYATPLMSEQDPWRVIVKSFKYTYPDRWQDPVAVISISDQRLYLYRQGELDQEFPVSTSRYGVGNADGSYKTPLGLHQIVAKIGESAPTGTIFKHRKPTGEIAKIYKTQIIMPFDFVTTRILQLEGMEPGKNKGHGIDTFARHIYIHGTHEEGMIGLPASLGCVRMNNEDIIELYEQMPENALVLIVKGDEKFIDFVR